MEQEPTLSLEGMSSLSSRSVHRLEVAIMNKKVAVFGDEISLLSFPFKFK